MIRKAKGFFRRIVSLLVLLVVTMCLTQLAWAQTGSGSSGDKTAACLPGWGAPVEDNGLLAHVLFDQLEGRSNGRDNEFRWDAEGWVGTDMNRLWLKSEGFTSKGVVTDGDQELLYDRPIPRWRYFDMQAGVREDLDSGPRRTWGALGIEGLAPYFFQFAPTFYFRSGGNVALRIEGSYDLLITQRLVAQPEIEMNFYNKDDRNRSIGSGLSEIDTGLRLRYEFSRKVAPYVGFAYNDKFGGTATYARGSGEIVHDLRFVFGLRIWR